MRSFRLFSGENQPPEKTAADYSEVEREQFQIAFVPVARRYRIFHYSFLFLGLATFFICFFSKQNDRWWLFFGVILFGVIYALLFAPTCPACHRKIDDGIQKFCPECGSNDLTPQSFMLWARCHSCGKTLGRRKGRSYKIRCCTNCGVFLNDKGI
jgi:RNA polymerase subunit RPABC4/transcription elongation factor Spt4